MKPQIKFLKNYGVLALWCAVVMLMLHSHLTTSYDPSLVGSSQYGHNNLGDFRNMFLLSVAEVGGWYAIIRPWSYRMQTGWRSLFALGLLTPWLLVSLIMTMHTGNIIFFHAIWVLLLELILIVLAMVTFWVLLWRKIQHG